MSGGAGLGGLIRDRRLQIGAAIAAGVGLVVLLVRRGQSGGGQAATLDSTGTDSYNAMQSEMQKYLDQLQALRDQLGQRPSGSPPIVGSDPSRLPLFDTDFKPADIGLAKQPKTGVSRK